jgi:hypothetical protein
LLCFRQQLELLGQKALKQGVQVESAGFPVKMDEYPLFPQEPFCFLGTHSGQSGGLGERKAREDGNC